MQRTTGSSERPISTAGATARRIPILTYHSLDDSRSPLSVAPRQFAQQMQALHASGWRTLDVSELLDGLGRRTWPARTFVLTFDDGYQNFCEQALPALLPLGFRAIVFVVGDWAGRRSEWPGQPAWAPRLALMNWDTLGKIAGQGMTLGAHTRTHSHLARLRASEAEHEIADSRALIEERTGCEAAVFAYPYGEASPALEATVGRHYRAGFGTRLAFCTASSRVTELERIDMYYLRGSVAGLAGERAWLAPYLALRRSLRWVRGSLHARRAAAA